MGRMNRRRTSFEDISSYTSKQAYKKNKKKKKKTGVTVLLSVLFTVLIVLGGGLMCVSAFVLDDLTTTSIAKDDESLGITENDKRNEGIINIALFGVDSREGTDTFVGRSDAIMVISVDTVHDKIKLTSLLRDSRVVLGDLTPNENGYDKLNHAYAYGGPQGAIRTVNQTFGLDIKNYVSVNLSGMAEIIDAFGGVEVDVTEEEIEQINNNIGGLHYENPELFDDFENYYQGEAGYVHLNGIQAVAYGRIRNIDSERIRAGRQQEILTALLGKLTSVSPMEYPTILANLMPLVETSLSISDIMDLAEILVDGFTIEKLVIPGEAIPSESGIYEGGAWMWSYDLDWAAAYIHSYIYEVEMDYVPPVEKENSVDEEESEAEAESSAVEEDSSVPEESAEASSEEAESTDVPS